MRGLNWLLWSRSAPKGIVHSLCSPPFLPAVLSQSVLLVDWISSQLVFLLDGFYFKTSTVFYIFQESLLNTIAAASNCIELQGRAPVWCPGAQALPPSCPGGSLIMVQLNLLWNFRDSILYNHTESSCFTFCVVLSNPGSLPALWLACFPLLLSVVLSQLGSAENRPEQSLPPQRFQLSSAFQQQHQQIQVIQHPHCHIAEILCSRSTSTYFYFAVLQDYKVIAKFYLKAWHFSQSAWSTEHILYI